MLCYRMLCCVMSWYRSGMLCNVYRNTYVCSCVLMSAVLLWVSIYLYIALHSAITLLTWMCIPVNKWC